MCEKCYDFGGWFLDSDKNRVFCVLEDVHGYHAKDMRGSYIICDCKIPDEYFNSPDHRGYNSLELFSNQDQNWFNEENLDLDYFS